MIMLTHFTFNTYKNKNSLKDKELREFLKQSFFEIAKTKDFKIINCELLEDHVHILIDYPKTLTMAKLMQALKGISSRHFFIKYPSNRFVDKKLWARSYYSRHVLPENVKKVTGYIKNQLDNSGNDKRYSES
jgi:putative transposase